MACVQAFFADQLSACRNNGMELPRGLDPRRGIPPQLIVYSDPRTEYVGDTLNRAKEAAHSYFKLKQNELPGILFVVLPEKGEQLTQIHDMCEGCGRLRQRADLWKKYSDQVGG